MRRKIYFGILSLCICLLWGKTTAFASEMPESQLIKVGWFESAGYFEKDRKNNLIGFGVDYLNAVANYTGWEYEFVEGTREECLEMLQNGEIDIMSPIRIDMELENVQISDEVIGENFGYIYKLGNNFNISYEEYSKFNQMIIGIEKGSGIEKDVESYCKEHNFHFYDIVYFDTVNEMQTELAERKIDAIAVDSYVNVDNLKVVGRFSNSRVTFAVSDETLLAPLEQAIENIKLDVPGFEEDLKQRYFSESSQTNLEYSGEEKEFLKAGRKYNVVLVKEQYPISYKSTEEMGQKGIVVDVLKKLEHYSGITFNIIYVDFYAQAEEMLQSGEADIFGGDIVVKKNISSLFETSEVEYEGERKEYVSEFYDMEMALVGRKGTDVDAHLKVAVPAYVKKCIPELEIMYPKYEFVVCDSDEECLNSILNRQVEAAVQSDLKINEITIYDKYKALQNLKFIPGNYTAAFTIITADDIMVNILNKTLSSISESYMATIENNNIQHIAMEEMTLWEFVARYWGYCVLIIILLGLINSAAIGYRKYRNEKKEKEKAYRDSLANVSSMEKFRIDVEPILKSNRKMEYFLISIDIEQFKIINDLYGYEEGDRVISYLGSVLKEQLEKESFITRSDAECFVILKKAKDIIDVEYYLRLIFNKVENDIAKYGSEYKLIIKAGIYEIVDDDYVLSSIIDKANIAKRNREVGHESTYTIYSETMRQIAIEGKKIENDMKRALEAGEFKVYLQPQVDLKTGKIVSAEALVRWIEPEKGLIPPIKFIPLFEKNGFVCKLDYY
ncbi:MAG: transporter substrate-binding domain-containing protein, partial [Lachnospiraceae bacterium]|nr:transporter substrate-binding domain-containing protein [Lachnospiraceae bacterium]